MRISQELKAIRFDAQHFPPGEEVAQRFVLGEMIGKGPFGEVYRATDKEIDAEVAVKIFDQNVFRNPMDQEKFLSVTRSARSMTQPNVVRLHDSGVHKDHPWVSMQLLEGLSLRKVLDLRKSKGENFTLQEIEPIVTQITLALQHVSRDFPHGDLKPENIIFLPDKLKVTDSYLLSALPAETIIPRLKKSSYLAPELHTAKTEPDAHADVYSVGTLIGELMFGPDYSPGSHTDGMHAAIDALVRRATAFDPRERYRSVEALSEDLTAVIDTGIPMERAETPPPPPAAPPTAPGAPPPSTPPVFASLAGRKDPEEQKSTVEFNRGPDIQDMVLTSEVQRDHLAPPPPRREPTASVASPKPSPYASTIQPARADTNTGWTILGVVVLGVLGAAVTIYMTSRTDDVEQIGQTTSTAVVKPVETPEKPDKVETTPFAGELVDAAPAPLLTATTAAQNSLVSATGAALAASTTGANPTEPDPSLKGEPVATASAASGKPATEKSSRSDGSASSTDEASAKQPAAGTKCPGGMQLVKSKKRGNYCIDTYEWPGNGSKPTTKVSWFQAKKSCESDKKRLCKLAEWRGACGSRYPYGRTFDADKCNTADEDGFERSLAKAGSFKGCRSRSGAYDMVGNAHEWVEEQRIAGGGFESDEEVGSCRYSSPKSPASSAGYIGYRCCATPE